MRHKPSAIVCLAFSSLLSACATPYRPPIDGPVARLTVSGFGFLLIDTANSCETMQQIHGNASVSIPAGKRIHIEDTGCVAIAFKPQEGATYVAERPATNQSCSIVLRRIESDGRSAAEPSAEPDHPRRCF